MPRLPLISLFIAIILTGCSCSHSENPTEEQILKHSPEIAAAAIAAADSVIAVYPDQNAVSDRLLEVKAHIYSISIEKGDNAARDFTTVFESHIASHNDSLARILF